MRFPSHLLQTATFRAEPLLAAMAAVAVGMFVGTWVIGPAITHDSPDAPAPPSQERTNFQDLVARPDPMPYRAATPSFDLPGPPNYAAVARDKARAELGDPEAAPDTPGDPGYSRLPSRSRLPDRHKVY